MVTSEAVTRGRRPDEASPTRRVVVLLSESAGLAAVLSLLLDPADRLSRLGSLRELVGSPALDAADVVVLDLPARDRAGAVGQLRLRYPGPVVVLVARGDDRRALRRDDACRTLTRPFSVEELGAALAIPAVRRPAAGAGGEPINPEAAARQAPVRPAAAAAAGDDLVGRVQRLLASITHGWRARRGIRLAGFSAVVLVAFTVAFALAAQGRCGPGCDAIGVRFSPPPSVAPAESRAPSTSRPKRAAAPTSAAPASSAATGVYGGVVIADEEAPATTTTRRATTTTRKPSPGGGGGGGGGAVTTRPPTTAAPTTTPTTLPTTTVTTTEPPPST